MRKLPSRKTSSTNYTNEVELVAGCPLAAALTLLRGRWKVLVLWYVHHGIDRFGALRRAIPSISEKMLFEHLRELEVDGLLVRVVAGARSTRYRLTTMGDSLVPHLKGLAAWSESNRIGERWTARRQSTSAGDGEVRTTVAR